MGKRSKQKEATISPRVTRRTALAMADPGPPNNDPPSGHPEQNVHPAPATPLIVTAELTGLKLNSFPAELDRDKVQEWARGTKVLLRYMGGTQTQRFTALMNSLLSCPKARTLVLDRLDKEADLTLEHLVDILQHHYGHRDPAAAAAKALQRLRQSPQEDFFTYYHRATGIFEMVNDLHEAEKLRALVAGLQTAYLDRLEENESILRQLNPAFSRTYQNTVDFLIEQDQKLAPSRQNNARSVELNASQSGKRNGGRAKPKVQSSANPSKKGKEPSDAATSKSQNQQVSIHSAGKYGLTEEEFERRKLAKHCFYCDEPWTRGHRCRSQQPPNARGAHQQA